MYDADIIMFLVYTWVTNKRIVRKLYRLLTCAVGWFNAECLHCLQGSE